MNTQSPLDIPNPRKKYPHVVQGVDALKERMTPDSSEVCLTGMRPSGQLHLGHYTGALSNWLKIQEITQVKCQFLIADYHVMADTPDVSKIRGNIYEVLKDWLAVGLDPEKSDFILQSSLPEWAELMTYLMNLVPVGVLDRNPTLKEEIRQLKGLQKKGEATSSWVNMGFYNYPISQAADILLPKGTIIPVWSDQLPHIELARDIVRSFNTKYGKVFTAPFAVLSEVPRLTGIDGKAKMSKSLGNSIMLADSNDTVAQKVKKMYTDPNRLTATDAWNVEGNVVFMHLDAFCTDISYVDSLKEQYRNGAISDQALKWILTEILNNFLDPIRSRREKYSKDERYLRDILEAGTNRARLVARRTMNEVRDAMGILSLDVYEYSREVPSRPDIS